jgi:hypothetical protein
MVPEWAGRAAAPDRGGKQGYPDGVIQIATRLLSCFALVAAMLWVAVPAVVMASAASAQLEGEACPCCEGKAALGTILACPGCQAGMTADSGLTAPQTITTAAWLIGPSTIATGIEPAPAEPPPR